MGGEEDRVLRKGVTNRGEGVSGWAVNEEERGASIRSEGDRSEVGVECSALEDRGVRGVDWVEEEGRSK